MKLADLENIFYSIQTAITTNEENPINKIKEYIIDEEIEEPGTYSQMVMSLNVQVDLEENQNTFETIEQKKSYKTDTNNFFENILITREPIKSRFGFSSDFF